MNDAEYQQVKDQFEKMVKNTQEITPCRDYLDMAWFPQKQKFLYQLFGGQLIYSKEIKLDERAQATNTDYLEDISEFIWEDKFDRFRNDLLDACEDALGTTVAIQSYLITYLSDLMKNTDTVAANNINADRKVFSAFKQVTLPDGKVFKFGKDQKFFSAIKAVIMKIVPFSKEFDQNKFLETWKELNLRYSQIKGKYLNDSHGELCISIHPLDYITLSNNDNDWESCLYFGNFCKDEGGGYQRGCLEMLSSEYAVVAYLKSKKRNYYGWNSKKWRSLIIVTPELIHQSRNYPFDSDFLTTEAIKMINDLAIKNLGYGYDLNNRIEDEMPGKFRVITSNSDIAYRFSTNYMYNDLGCHAYYGFLKEDYANLFTEDKPVNDQYHYIEYGIESYCLSCGAMIDHELEYAVICHNCYNEVAADYGKRFCVECGSFEDEEYMYQDSDGNWFCESCWNQRFIECECCGRIIDTEMEGFSTEFIPGSEYGYYTVCDECGEAIREELEEHKEDLTYRLSNDILGYIRYLRKECS